MRHFLHALLLSALAAPLAAAIPRPAAAAGPEPRAIEAFVDLVLGACMAEKAGAALVADAIDPQAVGLALEATNRDPRLGPGALRIPATGGVVYHEREGESCYVHADGIDAAAALADVEEALRRSGVPVMPFSDGVVEDADGVGQRTAVYGVMVSPTAPALPVLTLSYPVSQPVIMTAEVRAATVE